MTSRTWWLLDGQIGRLGALEDLVDEARRTVIQVWVADS
jgi:hypothetical protein